MKQEEPETEILTALSMIDRQKRGIITVSELRAKLTRLGEKLSEEEGILQFKDASNAPHLLISFLIFLCSQIWDQVLPAGKPGRTCASRRSCWCSPWWGEKGCPTITPETCSAPGHRALPSCPQVHPTSTSLFPATAIR